MELKYHGVEIPSDDPFKNCKLGREKYADNLTTIIENYNKNLVLAIDNSWGVGKTTFIKMWEQKLQKNYKTVFFNAWENDFEDEPLAAILGELKQLRNNKKSIELSEVVKIAANLSTDILPAILKAWGKKHMGEEALDIIAASVTAGTKVFEKHVEDYSKKKKSLREFRDELESAINEISNKPVIFFIDELDRCRPNYSVSVLEKIKHFFNVKNIIFILAIDKEQLSHAICGVYNSDNINAKEYLKRFIDLEFTLPQPKKDKYIELLINELEIERFFADRKLLYRIEEEYLEFYQTCEILFEKLTPRNIEKIFSVINLVLIQSKKMKIYSSLLLFLIYLKFNDSESYNKLKSCRYSLSDIAKLIASYDFNMPNLNWVYIESLLVVAYSNYNPNLNIHTNVYSSGSTFYYSDINQSQIAAHFSNFDREFRNSTMTINLLGFFDKIELTNFFEIS